MAVALALLLASPSTALRPNTTLDPCVGHETTAKQFRPFASKAWRLIAWERGKPPQKVIRAMRLKLRCAAGPGHLTAMKDRWRRAKAAFRHHRQRMLERISYLDAVTPPGLAPLEAIAACESGGNPGAVSPDGSYRGKYQFDYGTWESVGGSGDPAAASEREQDERAAQLYRSRGAQPWPVCGA